ncbi:hypothetical protein PROFUN_03826 [Planoprotostelium fungivorum]|uniref:CS domain-containing protein n=1 Tax=Planoprotostelium fungivorum TaxID=1890364 RepID=A0A2P6NIA8_9EUKA|nr:hypothetical protein PROFUN_03826 [Planoprotostelium fungivorum]
MSLRKHQRRAAADEEYAFEDDYHSEGTTEPSGPNEGVATAAGPCVPEEEQTMRVRAERVGDSGAARSACRYVQAVALPTELTGTSVAKTAYIGSHLMSILTTTASEEKGDLRNMITPPFTVVQDADHIIIELIVPHIKAKEVDFYIDDTLFKFHSHPYFLRLQFQQSLVEDGREKAAYDYGTGKLTIKLPKLNAGEDFTGLDDLNHLISKQQNQTQGEEKMHRPAIQVLNSIDEDWEDEDIDWEIDQTLSSAPLDPSDLLGKPKYGFKNHACNYFSPLQADLRDFLEIPEPDAIPSTQRSDLRIQLENDKWNPDHYMMDFIEDETILELIDWKAPWHPSATSLSHASPADLIDSNANARLQFNEEEMRTLVSLPPKEYIKGDLLEDKSALCGMVSLLFAYAYDKRVSVDVAHSESAWNVTFLSPVLCWLESFHNLKSVMVASYRRSLCYPLYRHWDLSTLVQKDVVSILALGKRYTLKALLNIKKILDKSEQFYHHSRLFLDDYCRWTQSVSSKTIKNLAEELAKVQIDKSDVTWPLQELEEEAVRRIMEEEDEE